MRFNASSMDARSSGRVVEGSVMAVVSVVVPNRLAVD